MATSGITFSGFNGFDFSKIIDAIMQQESQPLVAMQKQEQAIEAKDAALVQLGSQIGKLETAVTTLVGAGTFSDVTAASSDASILTTSLGSGAIAGHYDVEVAKLAKAQVTTSTNGFANTTDVVADGGAISFTIGGVTTTPIDVTSAATLADLRDRINNQKSGVVASIVNNGTTNKLVISSRQTGAANGFTINNTLTNSAGSTVTFAAGQGTSTGNAQNAQDAQLSVNSVPISSSTNTIGSAISGVTITVVKIGSAAVDVTADHGGLKQAAKTLVDEYNKLRQFYQTQSSTDSSGNRMPLANDSVMRQALSDIRKTLLDSNVNNGRFHYLAELGIEFTSTGELKFVESKFNDAVDSSLGDVQKLFQGTGGVFDLLKTRLEKLDPTAGLIKTSRDSIQTTLKNYRDRIDAQQLRLDLRRQELVKMYAAADEAISQLNQMSSSLQSINTRY
jgi:flagellar hook-associated protein 2